MADDLQLAYAANTQRAWRASWRVWVQFCHETGAARLPASVDTLRAFLLARIAAGTRRATLELNLSTLAMVHRLAALPWPLHSLEGSLMWRAIRRGVPARQKQKRGLSIDDIERMLAPLDPAVARDARDAALIPVAYETQLRRSNVVALTLEQVQWQSDGTATVLVERSKEDQEGQGRVKALSAETAQRLRHWVAMAALTEGALFRSTPKSNQPDRFANALSGRDVARIYKRRAAAIGMDVTEIAGHSTRIGAAQDLLAAGFSGAEIVREIGWRSERMLFRYTEHLQAQRGAMARFIRRRAASG